MSLSNIKLIWRNKQFRFLKRILQAVLLYLSEMAPARFRGAFSNGFQLTLCLGSLAANVINYGADKLTGGWGWRLSLGLAGVPAAFFTLGAVFLPETPNSLVQRGADRGKVRALLQRIRGTDAVDAELDDIVAASGAGGDGLRLILSQPRYRPQLAIAVLMMPHYRKPPSMPSACGVAECQIWSTRQQGHLLAVCFFFSR